MSDNASTFDPSEPSPLLNLLLTAGATTPAVTEGMQATLQRVSEFPSLLAAKLAGMAMTPAGRDVADRILDTYWSDEQQANTALRAGGGDREVIIGSGFHAAVYAAIRALSGGPKPLVLERNARVGGTFAMTTRGTFYLNSRNRAGTGGLAGDQAASLNYLPGAPVQAADLSMSDYQTNADMAAVIRLTLAQFAEAVVTNADVVSVDADAAGVAIELADRDPVLAGRVIDARGLGDPADQDITNGTSLLTFTQFMQRMNGAWPLRGLRRVAVVGGGDSARCAVESLLGIAPPPFMAAAALDSIDRIDWYAPDLPTDCDGWTQRIRGRYQAIGRYLRSDRFGLRRLHIFERRARPVALPGAALIDGRTYDLAVVCTGHREADIQGLSFRSFTQYADPDTGVPIRKHVSLPIFRVGPHARLAYTDQERNDGVADTSGNAVSMFRLGSKTAALAAMLRPVSRS